MIDSGSSQHQKIGADKNSKNNSEKLERLLKIKFIVIITQFKLSPVVKRFSNVNIVLYLFFNKLILFVSGTLKL